MNVDFRVALAGNESRRELGMRIISGAPVHIWCFFSSCYMSSWGAQVSWGQDEWGVQSSRSGTHERKMETSCSTCFSLLPFSSWLLTLPPKSWTMNLGMTFVILPPHRLYSGQDPSLMFSPLFLLLYPLESFIRMIIEVPNGPSIQTSLQSKFHVDFRDTSQNPQIGPDYLHAEKKKKKDLKVFSMPLA